MGHRIAKHVYDENFQLQKSTYYILDASGNVMATYDKEINYAESKTYFKLKERHIYGSSRVGVRNSDLDVLPLPDKNFSMTTVHYSIGSRTYELSNHLGNVLSVISDKVIPVFSSSTVISEMLADIRVAQDYSPFGVTLDGRNFVVDEGYRFGFNSMEKDDEIKGEGNSYDFGARMYDSRLGRFLSLDKFAKKFPHETPYMFAGNSPLLYKDLNGDFKIIVTEEAKKLKGSEITVKRFEAIIADLENYLVQNPHILQIISCQTGLDEKTIRDHLQSGQGPTIFIGVENTSGARASKESFDKGGFMIDYTLIDLLESSSTSDKKQAATLNLVFANMILHEYIHYGDRLNNKGKISGQKDGDMFNANGTPKNGPNQDSSPADHRGIELDQAMVFKLGDISDRYIKMPDGIRLSSMKWTISQSQLDNLVKLLNFSPRKPDEKNSTRTVLPKDQIKQ